MKLPLRSTPCQSLKDDTMVLTHQSVKSDQSSMTIF